MAVREIAIELTRKLSYRDTAYVPCSPRTSTSVACSRGRRIRPKGTTPSGSSRARFASFRVAVLPLAWACSV
jgi:hypothetical protein